MKVCIVGLGAIGGTFAAWLGSRLPADEVSLSALARGATLAAVQAQGLRVEAAPGWRLRLQCRCAWPATRASWVCKTS
jgi:2-dehydropantoate 2-reductase